MPGGVVAPGHQLLRQPGQVAAGALVDAGEAGHHMAEQESRHGSADNEQDRRIDQRAHHPAAHRIQLAAVVDVARQRHRQARGAFGGTHQADVERREMVGLLLECGGKAQPFLE